VRVVVVGGGVTGLTAAHRLVKLGHETCLLERTERTGGIVATDRASGRVLEWGPDCFLSGTKPWARDLALELGLESELVGTRPENRRSFVLCRGRLEPIPHGFHLIAPTAIEPFLRSRILSHPGKVRALAELSMSPHPAKDESLRSFVTRRFGRELFARLAEPLVAGIYTADPAHLSLRATFPQFLDMERDRGSVTAALWGREVAASGARYGLFVSFKHGVATFTEALRRSLPEGCIATGTDVRAVRREHDAFVVEHERGVERADAVLVALPGPQASRVLAGEAELSRLLGKIPYASAATVNLVFRREQIRHPLDAAGFVIPSVEKRYVLACSFSSSKFEDRVAPGEVLLRAFLGGPKGRERLEASHHEIVLRTLDDLAPLLGIEGEPRLSHVSVMRDAMPQYHLGHLDLVASVEAQLSEIPGLALAGNALHGVGIPDCVRSAEEAVRSLTRARP
jgi:oxygen-dependent protoporphyrinogen oxidase